MGSLPLEYRRSFQEKAAAAVVQEPFRVLTAGHGQESYAVCLQMIGLDLVHGDQHLIRIAPRNHEGPKQENEENALHINMLLNCSSFRKLFTIIDVSAQNGSQLPLRQKHAPGAA